MAAPVQATRNRAFRGNFTRPRVKPLYFTSSPPPRSDISLLRERVATNMTTNKTTKAARPISSASTSLCALPAVDEGTAKKNAEPLPRGGADSSCITYQHLSSRISMRLGLCRRELWCIFAPVQFGWKGISSFFHVLTRNRSATMVDEMRQEDRRGGG